MVKVSPAPVGSTSVAGRGGILVSSTAPLGCFWNTEEPALYSVTTTMGTKWKTGASRDQSASKSSSDTTSASRCGRIAAALSQRLLWTRPSASQRRIHPCGTAATTVSGAKIAATSGAISSAIGPSRAMLGQRMAAGTSAATIVGAGV